jgi:hypothetical protein
MPKAVVMEEQPGKPGSVYFPFDHRHPLHKILTEHMLKIIEVPRPNPENAQVVVKMLCAALNRRDMFAWQRLYPGAAGNVPILADGVESWLGAVLALRSSDWESELFWRLQEGKSDLEDGRWGVDMKIDRRMIWTDRKVLMLFLEERSFFQIVSEDLFFYNKVPK